MKKTLITLCGLSLIAFGSLSAQQPAAPEDDNHWRDFKRKLIWKGPLAKTLLSASFNEIRDSPHEWGRNWQGFAKRAGNSFGQRAVKATVELGVSEWTHEDLHYQRLGEGGFFRRVSHAAVSTFRVRRDNGADGYTLAAGRIAGAFAAGQVSRTWMPTRVATFNAGLQTFGSTLALDVGVHIFTEFWPRKR
jgi:hypothetical protein